jgi:ligand-binding SRPBCC domain-containing protein
VYVVSGFSRTLIFIVGHVVVKTLIRAPIERCFDLARDVGVHCQTAAFTSERVLPPGRTAGLLELGEQVIFEGRHFGLRWRLTARITEMERPFRFVDETVEGVFKSMRHVHEFTARDGVTEMSDTLDWRAPVGLLGRVVDALLLERHLTWFVRTKQQALRVLAEGRR